MKWFTLVLILGATFFCGFMVGKSQTPQASEPLSGIQGDFARLTEEELKEYQNLKDQKSKFDQANLILGKVMQLFLIDLGLRAGTVSSCKITSQEIKEQTEEASSTAPVPATSSPPSVSQSAPAPQTLITSRNKTRESNRRRVGSGLGGQIPEEKAKGAVHALYQAILWRTPDQGGGAEATRKFSDEGWSTYINNAKSMITSREFLDDVEPVHPPKAIVNRMYAVFLGRCATANELSAHLGSLGRSGPQQIVAEIIIRARRRNPDKVFEGGFSPTSCTEN